MSFTLPVAIDPRTVSPLSSTPQLPVSDPKGHAVIITKSENEPVKNGNGQWMLCLTLQIVEGPHTGQEGYMRLNLGNQSTQAVEMAMRTVSAICHCIGHLEPVLDTAVLHNKKFRAVVALQKDAEAAKKGYPEVVQILDYNGNRPGEQKAGSTSGPAPAPTPGPAPQPQQQFPQQAPQPQQFAPPPQQQFPQQQMPQQFPQQFAQQPQQGFPQQVPQQQAPMVPQQPLQQQPSPQQQFPQGFPQQPGQAPAPWAQPPR